MSGLGKTLQEARRRRGLTLDDAERETRIRKRQLLALEQEDFAALPQPVYALGFLRLYARYLDLDPQPLVSDYREQTGAAPGPQPLTTATVAQFPPTHAPHRLSSLITLGLATLSAVGAFLLFQAVRAPANAVWSSIRQAVAPEAGEIRFPFVADLTISWPAAGPSESRDRVALGASSTQGGPSVGDAAGGGDRLPTTAKVPNVIVVPPWFMPPAPESSSSPGGRGLQMPSVIAQTTDEARIALEQLGLVVATEQWWNPEVPAGFVVYQHPLPEQPIERSRPAVIVISRGPIRLTIPDLAGRSQDEAQRLLQQAGLIAAPLIHYQGPKDLPPATLNKVCNGCVLSIYPPAGAEVPPEGIVTLAVRKD